MEPEKEIGKWLQGYQPACILMTANELKLFDAIAEEARTAEEVARDRSLSLNGLERLLNALVALGIAARQGTGYRLKEEWVPFLTRRGAHSMAKWIQLSADHLPVWERLPEFIRTGAPLTSVMDMLSGDPEKMRDFIDAMHDKALKAPQAIAQQVPLEDRRRLLDIGGGPGTYALEWARLYPRLQATVLDLEPVVAVAQEYIRRYGLEDRVDTLGADLTRTELPEGYDLALIANVLHMYPAQTARELVHRAVRTLEPGGRLIIHGFGTDDEGTTPLADALFSLQIGFLTEGGRAHPFPEMETWMREAGLTGLKSFRIEAMPTGVLTGLLPA